MSRRQDEEVNSSLFLNNSKHKFAWEIGGNLDNNNKNDGYILTTSQLNLPHLKIFRHKIDNYLDS